MNNWYPQPSVSFDLDGTLAEDSYPDIGAPVEDTIGLLVRLSDAGWWVVVHTSRPNADAPQVQEWCKDLPVDQFVYGRPNVDVQIDDKGLLPAAQAMETVVWQRWADRYREGWLHALVNGYLPGKWAQQQEAVAEHGGRPQQPDDFRVVVPLSGGLDSSTLWAMAGEAGLPREAVYVDMGQEYAAQELAAVQSALNVTPDVLGAPLPPAQWEHVLPGRNAAVVAQSAAYALEHDWWGEVWFGNLAGESPVVGGDKSYRFMVTAQQLLTLNGYDLRLSSPLQALDKPDLVRWWLHRDKLDTLAQLKPCLDPDVLRCGHCQTCFRFMVALEVNDVDTRHGWWADEDWTVHVTKYEPLMRHALVHQDWSAYSPGRSKTTLSTICKLRAEGRIPS